MRRHCLFIINDINVNMTKCEGKIKSNEIDVDRKTSDYLSASNISGSILLSLYVSRILIDGHAARGQWVRSNVDVAKTACAMQMWHKRGPWWHIDGRLLN